MTSTVIVAVLVGYLVILLAIGLWGNRESYDLEGYYVAGKRLPAWVIAFSSNATGESVPSGLMALPGTQLRHSPGAGAEI